MESYVQSYLLVITVWERQDGANTPLKNTNKNPFEHAGVPLGFINIRKGPWDLT